MWNYGGCFEFSSRRGPHAEVQSPPEDRGAQHLDKVKESVVIKGDNRVERDIARLHCGSSQIEENCQGDDCRAFQTVGGDQKGVDSQGAQHNRCCVDDEDDEFSPQKRGQPEKGCAHPDAPRDKAHSRDSSPPISHSSHDERHHENPQAQVERRPQCYVHGFRHFQGVYQGAEEGCGCEEGKCPAPEVGSPAVGGCRAPEEGDDYGALDGQQGIGGACCEFGRGVD